MMATIVGTGPDIVSAGQKKTAVSWRAIFAGAIAAIATTLIFIALGSGLGFAASSPWPGGGPTMTSFAIGAGIWLIVTQWLSSFLGGYITGRLRTRWVGVHTDEVFFRDTAHGLLAWAVATVIVATVAFAATASTVGAVANSATTAISYATDGLLRSNRLDVGSGDAARAEIGRILSRDGTMAADDRAYLIQLVATRTGISRDEAQQRVDMATTSIRSAADKARKVSSALGFFTALSMLIGAFIASVAAAYGGRLRDDHEAKYA
jgi:hypothetical protein